MASNIHNINIVGESLSRVFLLAQTSAQLKTLLARSSDIDSRTRADEKHNLYISWID